MVKLFLSSNFIRSYFSAYIFQKKAIFYRIEKNDIKFMKGPELKAYTIEKVYNSKKYVILKYFIQIKSILTQIFFKEKQ
jgi:hypothetical protein